MSRAPKPTPPKKHERPWGGGSIRERNGRFQAIPSRRDPDRQPRTFSTREAAERYLDGVPEPTVLLLGHYLERWLALVEPRLAPQTRASYRHALLSAAPLATRPLASLTAADWQALFNDMLGLRRQYRVYGGRGQRGQLRALPGTLSLATVRARRRVLVTALNAAVPDHIAVNPILRTRLAAPTEPRPKAWSAAEAQRFLATAAGGRDELLYRIALETGARLGELRALRWADLDVGTGTLTIGRSMADLGPGVGPTKTKRTRRVRVSPSTLELLPPAPRSPASSLLWPDRSAVSTAAIRRRFRDLIERASVTPITVHDLRHTCASLLLAAGVPVVEVSRLLGHARPAITLNTYAHVVAEHAERASSTMAGLLYPAIDAENDAKDER